MGIDGVSVLLVHMGSAEQGREFLARRWPEARAIADPDLAIYRSLGVRRGRPGDFLHPKALLRGVRDFLGGHGVGRPIGDPIVMPAAFLLEGSRIVDEHQFSHAGDHPDWRAFARGSMS